MTTIEQRVQRYCADECPNASKEVMTLICRSFEDGAKSEYAELTRWNKLEEPPEIPTGRWRCKRVLLKKESGDYATGWAELIDGQIRWTDGRVVFVNLIGWREIHE